MSCKQKHKTHTDGCFNSVHIAMPFTQLTLKEQSATFKSLEKEQFQFPTLRNFSTPPSVYELYPETMVMVFIIGMLCQTSYCQEHNSCLYFWIQMWCYLFPLTSFSYGYHPFIRPASHSSTLYIMLEQLYFPSPSSTHNSHVKGRTKLNNVYLSVVTINKLSVWFLSRKN